MMLYLPSTVVPSVIDVFILSLLKSALTAVFVDAVNGSEQVTIGYHEEERYIMHYTYAFLHIQIFLHIWVNKRRDIRKAKWQI